MWHAHFGHLNFASLLRLQKSEMVSSLPKLETPSKHVCEGCILGKMQRSSFPKDGQVRADRKLQLVHSDVCGPICKHYLLVTTHTSSLLLMTIPGIHEYIL